MTYDRSVEDLGNIVHLEHVNLRIPDQRAASLFYIVGLRLTRDPYLVVGTTNMWINIGRSQMHLPTTDAPVGQRLRGVVGLVLPDLDAVEGSLSSVADALSGSAFGYRRTSDAIEVTCPWGNRFRCHAPGPAFGPTELGMPYVELDVPPDTARGIAGFYESVLNAPATVGTRDGAPCASVTVGADQRLHFVERAAPLAPYDGHHIAVYIADFSGPYQTLLGRDLVTEESDQHQWRFQDIVNVETGAVLATIEHEVRSLRHPLYGRPLVNRNPDQSNVRYARGRDAFAGRL